MKDVPYDISKINLTDGAPNLVKSSDMFGLSRPTNFTKWTRGGNQLEIDRVSLFRRVRICNNMRSLGLLSPLRTDLNYQVELCEFLNGSLYCVQFVGSIDIMVQLEVY